MKITRKMDWKGLKVQSKTELENGLGTIKAGTIFTVESYHNGMSLLSDPCPYCGVSFRITRVKERDVTLLDTEENRNRLKENQNLKYANTVWGRKLVSKK